MNGDKGIISCIQTYFTNNQVNQNTIENLLNIGNQEGNKGRQQNFINRLFSIMQNRLTK